MRISDWSSDVCSSDLCRLQGGAGGAVEDVGTGTRAPRNYRQCGLPRSHRHPALRRVSRRLRQPRADRKSVVKGKGATVSVVLGGRSIIKKIRERHQVYHITQKCIVIYYTIHL